MNARFERPRIPNGLDPEPAFNDENWVSQGGAFGSPRKPSGGAHGPRPEVTPPAALPDDPGPQVLDDGDDGDEEVEAVFAEVPYPDYGAPLPAVEFLIPGIMQVGAVLLAGPPGKGKSSALLPLMMSVAGLRGALNNDPLRPEVTRRVVYCSEDPAQAHRIIRAVWEQTPACLRPKPEDLALGLRIVEAKRRSVGNLVQAAPELAEMYLNHAHADGSTVLAAPVLVLDTLPTTVMLESENDNAEVSNMLAVLRQRLPGVPIVLVAHTAHGDPTKARGATAFAGDVQQVCILVEDDDTHQRRIDVSGFKHRFETPYAGLLLEHRRVTLEAQTILGTRITQSVSFSNARHEERAAREKAISDEAVQAIKDQHSDDRGRMLKAAEEAQELGNPLSKTDIMGATGRRPVNVLAAFNELVSEGWLFRVFVPRAERANVKREEFYVRVKEHERDAVRRGEHKPMAAQRRYQGWHKDA